MLRLNSNLKTYVNIALLGFLITSCSSNISDSDDAQSLENDTVAIETPVEAKKEDPLASKTYHTGTTKSNYSYSYYIPDSSNGFSIYFIDAQGKGTDFIKTYQKLSDEYKFTLVGLNSIKNGLPNGEVLKIWDEVKNEFNNKTQLINKKMVVGFSGGARFATFLAESDTSILNVTGCSAGFFKPIKNKYDIKYNYFGLVGDEDFNYVEMMKLKDVIEPYPKTQFIYTYSGLHEWPKPGVIRHSFNWFYKSLVFDKYIEPELNLIEQRFAEIQPTFKNIPKTNDKNLGVNLLAELDKTEIVLFTFDGLIDCQKFQKQRSKIYRPQQFKGQLAQHRVDLYNETKQQQLFVSNLIEKDTIWWSTKIDKVNFTSDVDKKIHKRVLQYCGLQLYFLCQRVLNANNNKEFIKLSWIYSKIVPNNCEANYFSAIAAAIVGDTPNVIKNLSLALSNGLENRNRIQFQKEFNYLKDNPQFKQLTSS